LWLARGRSANVEGLTRKEEIVENPNIRLISTLNTGEKVEYQRLINLLS